MKEYELDYTRCATTNNRSESSINQSTCADYLLNTSSSDRLHLRRDACQCNRTFVLQENFTGPVYVYYFLTEFFQNHRRYVKSRDDDQLMGDPTVTNGNCDPFEDGDVGDGLLPYAPCGMIANSLFNDSFNIALSDGSDVSWTRTGIAWPSDYKGKFKNPEPSSTIEELKKHFVNVTLPPPSWPVPVWGLSNDVSNTGFINEDLIVWMRTAAFPRFRKLYAKIEGGLQAGVPYTVKINYSEYQGSFLLSFFLLYSLSTSYFFLPVSSRFSCHCIRRYKVVGVLHDFIDWWKTFFRAYHLSGCRRTFAFVCNYVLFDLLFRGTKVSDWKPSGGGGGGGGVLDHNAIFLLRRDKKNWKRVREFKQ